VKIRADREGEIDLTTKTISVEIGDLKAALSLLKAYANREKAGRHFKDNEQRLPDGYFAVRIARLEELIKKAVAE
jgi:hypothetical protein